MKTMPIYHLRSCVWEITLACCFSCKYCGSKAGHARDGELSTTECLHVAAQLTDLGCKRVALIGGEIFMRTDWATIAQALTAHGVQVSIVTNGYLFSDQLIAQIKAANIESVAVSLDGPERIHDKYRQRGSFQRAMAAIDILTERKIPVSVISTLHSQNVAHLNALYETLTQKQIFAWQLQACSPMGNAANADFSTEFDFTQVIRFVETRRAQAPFIVGIADNIGYYTPTEPYLRGSPLGGSPFRGCRAGLCNIGIDSVGNVRGCESLYDDSFIEGNLRERSLAENWNDPDSFSYNRHFTQKLLTGHCATCEFGARCAGGCRSFNFFSNGTLYESPRCARKTLPGHTDQSDCI